MKNDVSVRIPYNKYDKDGRLLTWYKNIKGFDSNNELVKYDRNRYDSLNRHRYFGMYNMNTGYYYDEYIQYTSNDTSNTSSRITMSIDSNSNDITTKIYDENNICVSKSITKPNGDIIQGSDTIVGKELFVFDVSTYKKCRR